MFDLLSPSTDDRPQNPRTRGQLVLVTAVIVGFILLNLVVILNSGILVETLKGEPVLEETNGVKETTNTIQHEVGRLILYVNNQEYGPSSSNRVENAIQDTAPQLLVNYAEARGSSIELESVTVDSGEAVRQRNLNQEVTSNNNNTNWRVGSASNLRRFRFRIERVSLDNVGAGGRSAAYLRNNVFHIMVEGNAGNKYRMYVYRKGQTIEVAGQYNNEPMSSASSTADVAEIGFMTGTIEGKEIYEFPVKDLEAPYEVHIRNGDQARAEYTMTLDGSADASSTNNGGGNGPYVEDVAYRAELDISHHSKSFQMSNSLVIEPCSPNYKQCLSNGDVEDINN